jgi:hypothetical protein
LALSRRFFVFSSFRVFVIPLKCPTSLLAGAQTERRGEAGPVRDMLGGWTSLAAVVGAVFGR